MQNEIRVYFVVVVVVVEEYPQLPSLIEIISTDKDQLNPPDQKQIDTNIEKMIQLFIQMILPFVCQFQKMKILLFCFCLVN